MWTKQSANTVEIFLTPSELRDFPSAGAAHGARRHVFAWRGKLTDVVDELAFR
jgi:hypothetical protein